MSKLKVDNFYRFFIFDILILSHNKEEVDITMRNDIIIEILMLEMKGNKSALDR